MNISRIVPLISPWTFPVLFTININIKDNYVKPTGETSNNVPWFSNLIPKVIFCIFPGHVGL